jgi:pilus assembly protein Flp/PilA
MRKQFVSIVKKFARDERGASLLEYTILLGIITVAAIATIDDVGEWVTGKWAALNTNLGTASTATGAN